MELVTKMFVCAREYVVRSARGQTMTGYALVLAAVASRSLESTRRSATNIGSLANGVDSTLTNA